MNPHANEALPRRVQAVVFDIGGVLLDWQPERLYRRLIHDDTDRAWFLSNVCTLQWNLEMDAGKPIAQACEELAARYPEHSEWIHAWTRQDEMIVGEVPGTSDLVRSIRQAQVPLYLLTNMPTEVFASRYRRFEVLRLFDGAVVSATEGIIKPSAEIFELLIGRYRLDPFRTLFIDDSVANVEGARAAGFEAHHFTSAAALAGVLASHDLLG
jgi:2-haloacid dehalogenase